MYMHNDIAGTAVSGPHFKEARIDPVARALFLTAVVDSANARRRGLSRLGAFSIAPARLDDDNEYFMQIRAIPARGFGGCEFRFDMPTNNNDIAMAERRADDILAAASAFCQLTNVAKYIRAAKRLIADAIAPAADCLTPVRLISIGLELTASSVNPVLVADIEMIGADLVPGIDRISGHDIGRFEEKLSEAVANHLVRERCRNIATASRAIGWIDQTALNILDASGISRPDAIAMLRRQNAIEFYFGGDEGYDHTGSLFWEDGVIKGIVEGNCNTWTFGGDRLTMLNRGIPEVVLAGWTGRRFGAVVEHRFIPADAVVTRVVTSGEWVYVDIVAPIHLINEAIGNVRADHRVG